MSLTSLLSFKEKFDYGRGDVGVMFMGTKVVVAISDPRMGMIAYRTQTK